jgi:hypothetical protein
VSLRLFVSNSGEYVVRCMMMTSIVDPCVNDDARISKRDARLRLMHVSMFVFEESLQKRLPKNICAVWNNNRSRCSKRGLMKGTNHRCEVMVRLSTWFPQPTSYPNC